MAEDVLVIGIAGGTGSGKTTVTKKIVEYFEDDISVIYHDNYYKRHDEMPYEERAKLNYDHPDAFDTDRMAQDLQMLKQGKAIYCPVYDYSIHNRTDKTIEVRPNKVVLVEGILIFENEALRNQMDIKIFVDTEDVYKRQGQATRKFFS